MTGGGVDWPHASLVVHRWLPWPKLERSLVIYAMYCGNKAHKIYCHIMCLAKFALTIDGDFILTIIPFGWKSATDPLIKMKTMQMSFIFH